MDTSLLLICSLRGYDALIPLRPPAIAKVLWVLSVYTAAYGVAAPYTAPICVCLPKKDLSPKVSS